MQKRITTGARYAIAPRTSDGGYPVEDQWRISVNSHSLTSSASKNEGASVRCVQDALPIYTDPISGASALGIRIAATGDLVWAPFNLGSAGTTSNWKGGYYRWGAKTPEQNYANSTLWPSNSNPCPSGWRVPTSENLSVMNYGNKSQSHLGYYGNHSDVVIGWWYGEYATLATSDDNKGCIWLPFSGDRSDPNGGFANYWADSGGYWNDPTGARMIARGPDNIAKSIPPVNDQAGYSLYLTEKNAQLRGDISKYTGASIRCVTN